MKLSLWLLLLSTFTVQAVGYTQQTKVTLSMERCDLLEIIRNIRKVSDYRFLYKTEEVAKYKDMDCKVVNADMEEVLKVLLENTDLTFSINEGVVLIQKRKIQQQIKTVRITGHVRDENKQLLPGVMVVVKGMAIGTTTNNKGWYQLELPEMEDLRLLFRFIGMETKEVKYTGQQEINVVLKENVQEMEEVVVTGYQTMKKTSMAGSISSVRAEDLLLNGTQTLEQALQGQLPGVSVVNQSGLTGTRQKVRVRGTSTLVGNAEPVWVVDGVIQEDPLPFNARELTDIGDNGGDIIRNFIGGAISWLNPDDIDNIVVLKDASATAIYGVKAANGVIVITTKKGERGRLSLSYRGNFSVSPKMNYRKLELMNSKERVDASREAFNNGAVLRSDEPIGYMGQCP